MATAKKRNPLKAFNVNKSIFKGSLFELILAELLKKAGFTGDFESDQLSRNKKKLHGRGGTYAPDFYGVFHIGIPFINPLLLIVEAKYFTKKVGIKTAREFLGAYIDFSQYIKIDTKSSKLEKKYSKLYETRYTYCPVFFSMRGYQKPAQAFMYAHGINYISYENSTTIKRILDSTEIILKEINFAGFNIDDFKSFTSLTSLNALRGDLKKPGFSDAISKFNRLFELLNSFVAVIDQKFPISILHKGRIGKNWFKDVNIVHEGDGRFTFKNAKGKIQGEFTLPTYFLKEYLNYSKKKGSLDDAFKMIHIIVPVAEIFEIKTLHISDQSRTEMIDAIITSKQDEDDDEETETEEQESENK